MIETERYGNFTIGLYQKLSTERIPLSGTIEVTNRCPLECVHCYNNLPMSDGAARRREMTTEEHKRVVDELVELGCLWITYSGGEVFARADFLEIYEYAHRKGLIVGIFTNGTLITERIADFLAQHPPFAIEITLYGRTKATYESLTGIPGSFEKCLRGIRLLLDRKLPLKLKTVAISVNKHEVKAMKQFAEELGVEFKFDAMINPRIDCSSSPLAVRLTPADIVAMDLDEPDRIAGWKSLAKLGPDIAPEGEAKMLYDCGGGMNSFALDPYGNITICVISHQDTYNVRDGSVREGWESFLGKVREKRITRITKCTTCPLTSLCGSCAANGELENGDPEAPVDFLCRTAHLRAEIFELEMRPHGDCEYCPGASDRHVIEQLADQVRNRNTHLEATMASLPVGQVAAGCGTGACGSCSMH
jgi:radical SAM protein with 4Fe4S-binding SPASM domain